MKRLALLLVLGMASVASAQSIVDASKARGGGSNKSTWTDADLPEQRRPPAEADVPAGFQTPPVSASRQDADDAISVCKLASLTRLVKTMVTVYGLSSTIKFDLAMVYVNSELKSDPTLATAVAADVAGCTARPSVDPPNVDAWIVKRLERWERATRIAREAVERAGRR